ncbi:hypothetical protein [Nocardioides daejeonensis]|uniref:hypothetical protein n=1 Tax=Nocardioides daejeonensis TaxID=1046556 RepID=UPI000D74AF16|nr:hypothetical protein [Nocardioides daejeonensis]
MSERQAAATRGRLPRIAEQAVQRARLTVVPRVRRPRTRVPFVIFVSVLLVAGVIGLLMLNTTMQQNSFRATALESRADALTAQREGLEMELAQLNDPQQVAERALAMGMVEANVADYVDLSRGKVVPSGADVASPENKLTITARDANKPAALNPPPKYKWRDPKPKNRRARDTDAASTDRLPSAGRNGSTAHRSANRSNR